MATYNWTDNANAIPTIIARKCLEIAKANMQITKNIRIDYANEIASAGDTVDVIRFTKPTVQEKIAGTAISSRVGATTSKVSIALEKHFIVPMTIEDTGKLLSAPDALAEMLNSTGIAMAEKIETYVFNLIVAHGAASASYRVGTFGSAIDETLLKLIKKNMDDAKIPPGYDRRVSLGADGIQDIFGISTLTTASNVGLTNQAAPVVTGILNTLYGLQVSLNQCEPITDATPDQQSGIAFVKPAIALVTRPLPLDADGAKQSSYTDPDTGLNIRVTMQYDSNNVGTNVNVDCLVGAKIVIPEWCWEIRH